ncbi:testis-expressed protein 19 [Myotis daubentonii]|uniref:testis-expressed protein 19 n=1 Tax=Myotis daubentonii TaxID=98922 RepID=UPI0028730C35|nr:testis-expressed protein 19 [Myotis daubentonii]
MCSPGSERPGREGVSQLHAFWLQQLQQRDQLRLCFPCFRLLFRSFKGSLEAGAWGRRTGTPEPAQHPVAGPGEGPSQGMGPSGWQGLDQPEQGGLGDWGSDTLASDPDESGELGLMPTELTPQNAVPPGLGPEHADWTHGRRWRFGGVPTCSHRPSPYVLPQSFPHEILPPGEPRLLELVATRRWTLHWPTPGCCACRPWPWWAAPRPPCTCLRHMAPRWVRRTPGPRWGPTAGVSCSSRARPGQHLSPWRPSVLESCPPGHGAQLVPAGTALLMRGFRSSLTLPGTKQAEDDDPGSGPEASPKGRVLASLGQTAGGPGRAWALRELPYFQPLSLRPK